jgi:predicted nucleic acid-binding protein
VFTLDASVFVGAFVGGQYGSPMADQLLDAVERRAIALVEPTLLVVEVAASVARVTGDEVAAAEIRELLLLNSVWRWLSLTPRLARDSAEIAARARLRAADSVYAAVARRAKTTLVTIDREQLTRLAGIVPVVTPNDALSMV